MKVIATKAEIMRGAQGLRSEAMGLIASAVEGLTAAQQSDPITAEVLLARARQSLDVASQNLEQYFASRDALRRQIQP